MGTGTRVETRGRTQDGNVDGNESSSGDGNGDEDNGNEDRIGEGGGEAGKSVRNLTRVLDAMWETGETCWVKEEKTYKRKGWSSSCQPR